MSLLYIYRMILYIFSYIPQGKILMLVFLQIDYAVSDPGSLSQQCRPLVILRPQPCSPMVLSRNERGTYSILGKRWGHGVATRVARRSVSSPTTPNYTAGGMAWGTPTSSVAWELLSREGNIFWHGDHKPCHPQENRVVRVVRGADPYVRQV